MNAPSEISSKSQNQFGTNSEKTHLDITLYIAGPMTGHPQLNYPAFHHAAKQLREAGYTVLNPAEGERPARNPTWEDWMRQAIGMLIQADHIATLDGWHESRGAVIEVNLANNLGMGRESIDRHLEAATKMQPATPVVEYIRERERHPVHIPEHLRDIVRDAAP